MPPKRHSIVAAGQHLHASCAARGDWIIEGCYGDLIESALVYALEPCVMSVRSSRRNHRPRVVQPTLLPPRTGQGAPSLSLRRRHSKP